MPALAQHALDMDLSRYGSGRCVALLHRPAGPSRGIVVFAHPFAEELNKSRRMVALQARALAAQGLWVLCPDLHGCGDSPADLADADWDGWVTQLAACAAWLRATADAAAGGGTAGPLWWWGLRQGALLAAAAARRAEPAAGFLFWQPPAQGKPLLQQFLRLRVAAQMVSGEHRGVLAELKAGLQAGQAQQIAGYTLPAAVANGLDAATLQPPEAAGGRGADVLWFELASPAAAPAPTATDGPAAAPTAEPAGPPQPLPASRPVIARWQQAGHAVQATVLPGPAFWSTAEIETADALVEASTTALVQRLGPAPTPTAEVPAAAPASSPDAAEQPLVFDCHGDTLVGVLHRPAPGVAARSVGVVVVVGGPQYRVGSHRQFVHLARTLAAAGHPVLRFDVRGMGDSSGTPAGFEQQDDDIDAAVGALHAAMPGLQGTVLWGLCDGASAALMYLQRRADVRIAGLALANPWVRSAATQARTLVRHYYWDRLRQRGFWLKLLRGGVAGKALADLRGNLRAAGQGSAKAGTGGSAMAFQARMALGWLQARQPLLLMISGQDYTAREFLDACATQPAWRGALDRPNLSRQDLPQADHTFSGPGDKDAAAQATLAWLQRCFQPGVPWAR